MYLHQINLRQNAIKRLLTIFNCKEPMSHGSLVNEL